MQASQILANADIIYSNDAIANAVQKIADDITLQLKDTAPVVICLMSGGLMFAGYLLTKLLSCENVRPAFGRLLLSFDSL